MSIQTLPIEQVKPHPDNPRLFLRDEVIEGIKAQIETSGEFDPAHALLVRPVNGHYQILRGHHRYEAARRVGLESLPCWVREMDDKAAYMQLALSNVQGELSPLEIGIHALRAVELGNGGRGQSGGISEYARQLGKSHVYITQSRQAAVVLSSLKHVSQLTCFLDKSQHLAAIHKAPETLWQILVDHLITDGWSVNQTAEAVKIVNRFDVPDKWQGVFLNLSDVVSSYLNTGKPTPDQVRAFANSAEAIEQIIKATVENTGGKNFDYTAGSFCEWLKAGIGTSSWSEVELQRYRNAVILAAQEAQKPPEPEPEPGQWWQLGRHLLYCGDTGQPEFWQGLPQAQFAFADPPYNAEAAEWDKGFQWSHDWLIEKSPIVAVTPGISSIDTFFKNSTRMPYAWSMAAWIKNGMTRGALGFGNWVYIAVFSSLESIYRNEQDFIQVTVKTSETGRTDHKGRKPSELLEKLLGIFTSQGDTVIDPFLGSGTTLFAAESTGRICIGGELSAAFCKDIIIQWQRDTGQIATRKPNENTAQSN